MRKIVIEIHFTDWNYAKESKYTKDWIFYRLNITMNYTMKSLKKQINQNFTAIYLYDKKTEAIINEGLKQYEALPTNIKFIDKDEYMNYMKKELDDYDQLYLVRLDSDDMYHKHYIDYLHTYQEKKNTKFLINQNGYILKEGTSKIAYWGQASPPFFVEIYKVKEFLNGIRYKLEKDHDSAIIYPHEILKDNQFMVLSHDKNRYTKFYRKPFFKGSIEERSQVKEILRNFI